MEPKGNHKGPAMVLFLFPQEVISMGNTFTIGIKNYKSLQKEIRKLKQAPEAVSKGIVSDFKKRAPGWIAKEVCAVYNIKRTEVRPKSGSGGTKIGYIGVRGKTIAKAALVYQGRRLTPVHFQMRPTAPPLNRTGYTIKATIKRGQRKTLGKVKKLTKKQKKNIGKNFRKQGKQNSAASPIMLLHTGNRQEGGTSYIPFQRMSQRRSDLEVRKTISMPQMVSSKRVEKKIDDVLSKNIGKRLDQHMSRYMK